MSTKIRKGPGRPTVDSERIDTRFERPVIDAIDKFRASEEPEIGRPEALRRLVTEALRKRGLLPPEE